MSADAATIGSAVEKRLGEAQQLLAELIAIESLPGGEQRAMARAEQAFSEIAQVQRVELSNALRDDRDYSDPVPDIDYTGRYNLRVVLPGKGSGKSLLLNSHIDTVPPSQDQKDPFDPRVENGVIFGRGACDAKGQVATIWLLMAVLKDLGLDLGGDVIAHIVVEEEVGGNGTLAMARAGEQADACVVLEPTDLRILSSVRGAIWFRVTLFGKSAHSGTQGRARSAIDMAVRTIEILKGYHARLRDQSRGIELFDAYPNPMPLTIGKLHAGNWPATAPGEAVLEGVLGLLPNKTADEVMAEFQAAVKQEGGPDIADNVAFHFMYRHDSSVCPTDHPLVTGLMSAAATAGTESKIDAMTASCDAFFYNNQLDIPTVVFGPGSLGVAHSKDEQIPLAELGKAAAVLAAFAADFCK
jgi:acetylornithine deacetylase